MIKNKKKIIFLLVSFILLMGTATFAISESNIIPLAHKSINLSNIAVNQSKIIFDLGYMKAGDVFEITGSTWFPDNSELGFSVIDSDNGGGFGLVINSGDTMRLTIGQAGYKSLKVTNFGPSKVTNGTINISY